MQTFAITKPVVTEKTYRLASSQNAYTFEVSTNVTKNQIKQAIEEIFSVTVVAVRTLMYQSRSKRVGKKRLLSQKTKKKRAVVTLKSGDSIDLFNLSSKEKSA
ncbi:MAG: 50S ribosomal protein L23 [Candidatus Pacebacteria bacterium RIFCSPHIGHO2_01_FULL_46_16]|nr:MAG: 50S ribosomal protein L23 [Candidatus Pacebacteria bacterium RIFCSPHIGHO2_01_FULL_46_16]OGJ22031.1 MAG: 50S ribosomal protein L23 [Candidatus Pacebacteria bacterium RIFCSPHIGHO2_02_FULL_46_9]OGJ38238.1 MAG: 50S ribosomal protein L23 [Candidatus Pacebacteria bacterium RIFCSPLOWO2_01_FULL_47_12]